MKIRPRFKDHDVMCRADPEKKNSKLKFTNNLNFAG